MARVKRGVTSHAKHKKVLKAAKGFYGRRKNTIRIAKQAVEKANQYAFRDRKRRKRTFRALWIQRLNAAVRPFGLNYQPLHRRASTRPASSGRPQGAVRSRDPRAGGIPGDRREGQGRAAGAGAGTSTGLIFTLPWRARVACRRAAQTSGVGWPSHHPFTPSRSALPTDLAPPGRGEERGCHVRHRPAATIGSERHRRGVRRGRARSRARRRARQERIGLGAAEDARHHDAGRAQGAGAR